ncbi:hypothetical protein AaE_012131, partial [Aphanomyces astaci]
MSTPIDTNHATDTNHAPPAGFETWTPAAEGDSVSPCPFLNTMANYGILPRTGITQPKLKSVLELAKVDWAFREDGQALLDGISKTTLEVA